MARPQAWPWARGHCSGVGAQVAVRPPRMDLAPVGGSTGQAAWAQGVTGPPAPGHRHRAGVWGTQPPLLLPARAVPETPRPEHCCPRAGVTAAAAFPPGPKEKAGLGLREHWSLGVAWSAPGRQLPARCGGCPRPGWRCPSTASRSGCCTWTSSWPRCSPQPGPAPARGGQRVVPGDETLDLGGLGTDRDMAAPRAPAAQPEPGETGLTSRDSSGVRLHVVSVQLGAPVWSSWTYLGRGGHRVSLRDTPRPWRGPRDPGEKPH